LALVVALAFVLPAVGGSSRHRATGSTIVKYLSSGTIAQPPAWASSAPKAGGLAVDADGNVYVSVWNPPTVPAGGLSDIAVFDRNGKFLRTFGVGIRGSSASLLATGPNGLVYATVGGGGEGIDVFTSSGTLLKTIGRGAGLGNVNDLEVDAAGNVYLANDDPPSVVRLDAAGNVTARWPVALPATPASPRLGGLAVAPDGSVYVARAYAKHPLVHLDANGKELSDGPKLEVLLAGSRYGVNDVDLAGGNLYVAAHLHNSGDNLLQGLAVVTTAGKLVDLVPAPAGSDVTQVAVAGADVYATGYLATSRSALATATVPELVTRYNGQVIPTPRPGDSVGQATCESGGATEQNDLMVPLLTVPGASASSCIFRILNVKDPCPSGMRIDKANYIYVGGRATVGFVDLYPQPGIASRITFPGGSVRDGGDIVVDWVCTGGGRSASVYEWKGEIVLHDPSGTVFDAKNGRPVKAASLRLEFSPQRAGPFGTPGVSGIEPQVNPQLTSSNGLFGWNVADGYWRIRVRVFGYKPFTSPVYKVPPPVTGLKLKLVQDPAQQRLLIDPSGRIGSVRLGAAARRVAGLTVRVVRGKVRRIDVRSKRFRTAEGIKLGSSLSALHMAFPPSLKRTAKKTPANVVRVAHATFTIKSGRVSAISIA
jgi:sugar lactone lactonase YvrE